jgi:hypothetical protein
MWAWHAVAQTPEGYSDSALGVQGVNMVHKHPDASVQYKDVGDSMTVQDAVAVDYDWGSPWHSWP